MAAWVYLALTLVLLIFQIHLAVRARPIFRVVLIGQSIFWMAAYVLRSAYFLVVKPTNSIMLADPRLVHDGYSEVLSQVLVVVFWGTFTYVGTLWLFLRNSLTRNQSSTGNQPHDQYGVQQINTLTILYGLGWLGRFAFLMNWSKYLSGALMPLAVVSGALLVAYAKRGRLTFLPNSVIFVALAEVGWAFIFESKTAFFVPVLALTLRVLTENSAIRKGLIFFTLACICIPVFFVLQQVRGVTTDAVSEYRDYAAGNAIFGNSLTLLERFDGLSSITDSEYSKVQSGWISPLAYAEEFGLNLVPKGPFSEQQLSIGQQWNVEVASQSRPEISRNVSLAAGVIAEGDALAGAPAVVILMSLFAVCVFFLLKYLEAWGNTLKVMAAFIVFSPDLYETGFLSLAAGINKSLQIGLVYWLVSIVVKSLHKNQVSNGL